MGKYNKLYIDKASIDKLIEEFFGTKEKGRVIGEKVINSATGQTRYTIDIEDEEFEIDFFFRGDKTTTILPTGKEESKKLGIELAEYILSSLDYENVKKGTSSLKVNEEIFTNLINYFKCIEGVELVKNEDVNNGIGTLYKFRSEIGDTITLTYFKANGKLLYQGCLFKLYSEMKCFLAPFNVKMETKFEGKTIETNKVDELVKKHMPNSYDKIDSILVDFVHDSFAQINSAVECKDYSAWAFSALKGLEAYIKQLFLKNGTVINDKKGFAVTILGHRKPVPTFTKDGATGEYIINAGAVSITNTDYRNALEESYRYFNANRHLLFHTKQILATTKRIEDSSEAELIVYKVCEIFEKYYELII